MILLKFLKLCMAMKILIDLSEVHGYSTRRHGLSIKTPSTVTIRRKKFFDIRIINDWNKLPENIVYSKSIGSFKRALDGHYSKGGTSN